MQSGSPFNIVVGQDLNGDSQFNDRPAFATDLSRPSVLHTAYGAFDTLPLPGARIIPINYGNGPGLVLLSMSLRRGFNFGPVLKAPEGVPPAGAAPAAADDTSSDSKDTKSSSRASKKDNKTRKPKPPERRFHLDFGIDSQNILNHTNPSLPVGTLGSPLFGRSNALNSFFSGASANRTVDLQMIFHF